MVRDSQETASIAIIGAGIGGLALAIGLYKKGVPFTIYEEAPCYSVIGAGIGLGPNGLQAMDMIENQFRPEYEAICTGNKSLKDQHVFFEGLLMEKGFGLDQEWAQHSTWGSPGYQRKSAHRKELLDILTSFFPVEKVNFGKKLVKIDQMPHKIVLSFADDTTAETAAVVGGDGIQSSTRRFVLGRDHPDQVEPVYADMYCYRGIVPIDDANTILGDLTDTAKIYFGRNANCVTYRISGGKEFNFLLSIAEPGQPFPVESAVTQKVSRDQMLADFDGRNVDERLLRLLDWAQPVRWGLFHHKKTSTYHRGRVVLLGDSAHASMPFQAAGAGQGVEDALVLSHLIDKAFSGTEDDLTQRIQAAFHAYDAVRRPRAQAQLEQSADCGLLVSFQHPEAGSDMEKALPLLQQGRFDWLWYHDLSKDLAAADLKMAEQLAFKS